MEFIRKIDQVATKLVSSEQSVLNILLIVGVFATLVAPSLHDSMIKIYHHEGFRLFMLAILGYTYFKKSILSGVIVLIFFLSTQVASVQKEHYAVLSEHFRGINSESVDEPLLIPTNYLKESGVDNLQGSASDVPPDEADQYVVYPATQESTNRQMASGEPITEIPHDQDNELLAYSGEELAQF